MYVCVCIQKENVYVQYNRLSMIEYTQRRKEIHQPSELFHYVLDFSWIIFALKIKYEIYGQAETL
jgi:hypothetical protein